MAAFTLQDDQKVAASVSYVDAAGNASLVEGPPVWETTDANIVTVLAAADGLSASIIATGPLGSAQVRVTADADLGAGVVSVIGLQDMDVVAGQTVAAVFSMGVPEPK